ncbi:MAG TPA: zinc ribbon domain-containing protein, partial [Mycobacterium sp.]|nr:zinc ribbon domain-containing protein [Mycobacterium sp.]
TDAYKDLPRRALLLAAVLAVLLGVGWAEVTGAIIARSYDVAFGTGMEFKQPLWEGLIIPVGGAVTMLIPTLLARLRRVGTRESLDGFMIGTIAAMSFTAAATLTRLAPQFSTGLITNRPIGVLIAEAGIRGVAMSLTAAAAGGMVGATLWFTKPAPAHQHRGQSLARPLPALAVVLTSYAVLGLVDASPAPQTVQLVVHLVVAGALMLALRLVLHMALLREAHDPITQEPLLCEYCSHVVPDMAFCPACGVATRASSRSSRTTRRHVRPVRVDAPPEDP